MSWRMAFGLLLSLSFSLLALSVAISGAQATEEWHIQTPHFAIGDEQGEEARSFQKDPVVSPNGTRIAYSSREDGGANFDIWTMDLDGNNKLQITNNPWDETKPAFTPDGRWLTLVDRWGTGYMVESYGPTAFYPHYEHNIWNNLTYQEGNWTYTYPLVPTVLNGIWGTGSWQIDRGNWSVISQLTQGDESNYLRFYEMPPILKGYNKEKGYDYELRLFASPFELYRWNWWEISTNQYRFAEYNETQGTWRSCDSCDNNPRETFVTPEWLDVESYVLAYQEPEERSVYLLAGYDNTSYLQIYSLELPWRTDDIRAYDWVNASLNCLTKDEYNQKDPVFNHREGMIYYTSKEDGGSSYDLWKMDLEGGNRQQITYEDHSQLTPTFGPEFDQIFYASDEHGDYFFDIFRTSSQPGVQLTNFKGQQSIYRVFGAEGTEGMITYLARDPNYHNQVWVSRMDGSEAIQVTDEETLFQMGLDDFKLQAPRMNRNNDTIAVDVLYKEYFRGQTDHYFTQLMIYRVGKTWESRDYELMDEYRADFHNWPQQGTWYNASNIAFDPTDRFFAYTGPYKAEQELWARHNVPSIWYRASGKTWQDGEDHFYFDDISGYDAKDYVHHSPAWTDANNVYMLRADKYDVSSNGYDVRYEIVRFYTDDQWRSATVESTGISAMGVTHLTAVLRAGDPVLAWIQPVYTTWVSDWELHMATWDGIDKEWDVEQLTPAGDGMANYRSDPVFLDANHLLYGANNPMWDPSEKGLKIYNLNTENVADRPGTSAVSSIGFIHVSPSGKELLFLGEELDNDGDQGSGDEDTFRGSGPVIWFFDLQTNKITNVDLNTATCVGCNHQGDTRFSLLLAHYRTNSTMLLTLVVETWEDRGNGDELVDLSTTGIYLYDRKANSLRPLITSPYEELVTDVKGNAFLYSTTKDNIVGEADVWLAVINSPTNLTRTRLTNLPYMQWDGIFSPHADTIHYVSQESGDEIMHIWELTRLGPSWGTRSLPTQRTFERGNYEWMAPMGNMELLLYIKELPENRNNRDLYILDLTTGQEVPVATDTERTERSGVFSPATNTIYYILSGDGDNELDQIYAISFDGDGDGVTENLDEFPSDPTEWSDNDGDGFGDNQDPDDDNDLAGPDGIVGTYDDGNGRLDNEDAFKFDAAEWEDTDGDGVGNNADAFDTDPAASKDTDGDGFPDEWNPGKSQADSTSGLTIDAFPTNDNEGTDTDGDGQGDNADTDDDNDGVLDTNDDFPLDDTDYLDTDGDTLGDNVDTDDDGDGFDDDVDAFPLNSNEWSDFDGDGVGDNADSDDDNDGTGDSLDPFPKAAYSWTDLDGDGKPGEIWDYEEPYGFDDLSGLELDTDVDGDGYLEREGGEDRNGNGLLDANETDFNNNGIADGQDIFPDNSNEWYDSDLDGLGNNADTDDDNDGILDIDDEEPEDAEAGWWDTPIFGKTSSKRVKATLTASSPILISIIAGPISFIMIKRTRFGHYKRAMKKITDPKELKEFYIFDMDVAMYNWKVWWKHQMKLREIYAERMKELGGDPTIPTRGMDRYRDSASQEPPEGGM